MEKRPLGLFVIQKFTFNSKLEENFIMIQENIIHLVEHDNQGNDLSDVNIATMSKVCRMFNGFTVLEGAGAWISPSGQEFDEPILRVVVAFDPAASVDGMNNNARLFQDIAEQYKAQARQESVYIVIGGQVKFV